MTVPLFDADQTTDRACPIDGCHAVRTAGTTDRVPICQHDLDRAEGHPTRRPRACLNATDPRYTNWPEGF